MELISGFDNGVTGPPVSFMQNKYPKILCSDFSIAKNEQRPELCWAPPGHGDIYCALKQSGVLDTLLRQGIRHVFVSNADNLGATFCMDILGYMVAHRPGLLMEVTRRTRSDRKGGHLARRSKGGQLVLREIAQCPEEDKAYFQDIDTHRYFNTNSIWLDLEVVNTQIERFGWVETEFILWSCPR